MRKEKKMQEKDKELINEMLSKNESNVECQSDGHCKMQQTLDLESDANQDTKSQIDSIEEQGELKKQKKSFCQQSSDYFKNLFSKQGMKAFFKKYFIDAFSGMAIGLFCTLIIGTIIVQIAGLFGDLAFGKFLSEIGKIAQLLTGAGIGIGIAKALNAKKYVFLSAIAAGVVGANMPGGSGLFNVLINSGTFKFAIGDPISCYFSVVFAIKVANLLEGKTKIDILAIPLITITVGAIFAVLLGYPFSLLLGQFGKLVNKATELQPIPMGIIIALVMGILLTMPTSSAAFGVILGLDGLAAGAAVAGCAAHMIGFAVASFRENKVSGLISQGIGTSMLQIPNIMKNFRIIIPAVVASVIVGPIASAGFGLLSNATGSGMGTSGLVGVLQTIFVSMNVLDPVVLTFGVALCYFVIPAVVAFATSEILRKFKWIKPNDMKIDL